VLHDFTRSFETNKAYEAELDKHFAVEFDITPATRRQERAGIDRFFVHKGSGVRWSVEYKTDHMTATTGNVFVETVSVDTDGKPGWALTSLAQLLVYYVPPKEYALLADMGAVKRSLADWERFRRAEVDNGSYRTVGLLVPLEAFRAACYEVQTVLAPVDETSLEEWWEAEFRRAGL
jgi:hypothetical protein